MNGRIGRAKILNRIKRDRLAEAKRAGIDVTDRAAVRAWDNERSIEFYARLRAEIKKEDD